VISHHQGTKRKLQAGYRVLSLLCDALLCECCHIIDRWVWYHALSLCSACIRHSGIILTP